VCRATFQYLSPSIKRTLFFFVSSFSLILQYISQTLREEKFALFLPNSIDISKMKMGGSKRRVSSKGLGAVLKEQRAKLYIIRRCVVMLLCWHD
jgi:hypothetical protein